MLEAFEQHRPLLFSIAYRMLGTATDAEDIVQETYLRAQQRAQATPLEAVQSPKAFLATIATRLCLDRLKSAQVQRETYIGPWLPEPIATQTEDNPEERAELKDSISMAFLTLLERLNPVERAVFLLRQVFDYDYRDIAPIVDKSESACRQIFHRAQEFIRANRPRLPVTQAAHSQLLQSFIGAMLNGDLDGLTHLLHESITSWSDGGGNANAGRRPITGRDAVARLMLGIRKFAVPDSVVSIEEVNGWPAIVVRAGAVVQAVINIETNGQHIIAIRSVVNPDKLRHFS